MVVDVNDIALHYETFGEGEPLLWLHGFMGAGPDWTYIFKEPPDGYRLIAPDLRGHGASTNPAGTFSFRQSASDILALLRHLQVDRVKAIGLSGGGITLLHLAAAEPSRVSSMVVVSAPPYFPEQARAIQRHASAAMMSDAEMAISRSPLYGESQLQSCFADSRRSPTITRRQFHSAAPCHDHRRDLIVFGDRVRFYPLSMRWTSIRRFRARISGRSQWWSRPVSLRPAAILGDRVSFLGGQCARA